MFKYDVICEGNSYGQGRYDDAFETYEDAEEEANEKVRELLESWNDDNYSEDDFEIEIYEVI